MGKRDRTRASRRQLSARREVAHARAFCTCHSSQCSYDAPYKEHIKNGWYAYTVLRISMILKLRRDSTRILRMATDQHGSICKIRLNLLNPCTREPLDEHFLRLRSRSLANLDLGLPRRTLARTRQSR